MSNNNGADFARSISAGEELSRLMVEAEYLRAENERLREALREMLSVAEVDQLENLSICDVGSERAKMKSRAVASRCGMLLGKLRKIARVALGEGK
jgi:hypothetical protein